MTQRKRWLKTREFEKGECVAVRRPGKVDTDRNAKRPPFVCVLVWVYFVHERFESGFRDLTLCVKVLRNRTTYRSSTSLLLRPLQLRPLRELINLICNMLGNMLNDQAEAIRRWTEKKGNSERMVSHTIHAYEPALCPRMKREPTMYPVNLR